MFVRNFATRYAPIRKNVRLKKRPKRNDIPDEKMFAFVGIGHARVLAAAGAVTRRICCEDFSRRSASGRILYSGKQCLSSLDRTSARNHQPNPGQNRPARLARRAAPGRQLARLPADL